MASSRGRQSNQNDQTTDGAPRHCPYVEIAIIHIPLPCKSSSACSALAVAYPHHVRLLQSPIPIQARTKFQSDAQKAASRLSQFTRAPPVDRGLHRELTHANKKTQSGIDRRSLSHKRLVGTDGKRKCEGLMALGGGRAPLQEYFGVIMRTTSARCYSLSARGELTHMHEVPRYTEIDFDQIEQRSHHSAIECVDLISSADNQSIKCNLAANFPRTLAHKPLHLRHVSVNLPLDARHGGPADQLW